MDKFLRFPLKPTKDNLVHLPLSDLIDKEITWDITKYYVLNTNDEISMNILLYPHQGLKLLNRYLDNKKNIETRFVFLAHVCINTLLHTCLIYKIN